MQTPIIDKNYVKVFILYLMQNIGYPLDFNTINDVVIQDEFVGYFDFAQCFAELLDAGHVIENTENAPPLYSVSETGAHVESELGGNILSVIREKSLKSALKLISFQKKGAKVSCDIDEILSGEGGYTVTCSITEREEKTFCASVKIDTKEQAEKIKANFCEHPEVVYRGALALLSGDVNYIFDL